MIFHICGFGESMRVRGISSFARMWKESQWLSIIQILTESLLRFLSLSL